MGPTGLVAGLVLVLWTWSLRQRLTCEWVCDSGGKGVSRQAGSSVQGDLSCWARVQGWGHVHPWVSALCSAALTKHSHFCVLMPVPRGRGPRRPAGRSLLGVRLVEASVALIVLTWQG